VPLTTTTPPNGTTTTTAPPTTTTTPPPDEACEEFTIRFVKGVDTDEGGQIITTPLAGATFTLFDPNGDDIATLVTGDDGRAEITLMSPIAGTYRLVEDHLGAPGGPYEPFERPIDIPGVPACQTWDRNLHNVVAVEES